MSPFELNGPWTGAALREQPPLPYSIRRRRAWARAVFVVLAIMSMIGGGLWGLSHP